MGMGVMGDTDTGARVACAVVAVAAAAVVVELLALGGDATGGASQPHGSAIGTMSGQKCGSMYPRIPDN